VLARCELEPFAVETPAEVIYFMLIEMAKVLPTSSQSPAPTIVAASTLRLIDGWIGNGVAHPVIGSDDSESVSFPRTSEPLYASAQWRSFTVSDRFCI